MSSTAIGSPVKAAWPQEPTPGPTVMPSIASLYSPGRLGAAPCSRWLPS
nr:hypothetical protein [Patulibacter sp. DM4]